MRFPSAPPRYQTQCYRRPLLPLIQPGEKEKDDEKSHDRNHDKEGISKPSRRPMKHTKSRPLIADVRQREKGIQNWNTFTPAKMGMNLFLVHWSSTKTKAVVKKRSTYFSGKPSLARFSRIDELTPLSLFSLECPRQSPVGLYFFGGVLAPNE